MAEPTPLRRTSAQRRLGEIEVDDPQLLEDLRAMTALETALFPLKEKMAESTKALRTDIKQLREQHEESATKARIDEHTAALLVQHKRKLHDGVQLLVGEYVIEVKEYDHIVSVEKEKAFKVKAPLLIDEADVDDEDDD